jgi:hypothetical protein
MKGQRLYPNATAVAMNEIRVDDEVGLKSKVFPSALIPSPDLDPNNLKAPGIDFPAYAYGDGVVSSCSNPRRV